MILLYLPRKDIAPIRKAQPIPAKPIRAPLCQSYCWCLDVCAVLDLPYMPCLGCQWRQDVEMVHRSLRRRDRSDAYQDPEGGDVSLFPALDEADYR